MLSHITKDHGPTTPIKGTGIRRRRSGTHQLAELACDAVLGSRPFVLSNGQAAQIFGVPPAILREHLKARHKPGNNGTSGNNGSDAVNGNGSSTPAATAPDPSRLVRDHQLADLIAALDETIRVLSDLRDSGASLA
jgi:hypothetical protein